MPETQVPLIVETLLEAMETMAFVSLLPAEDGAPPPSEARLVRVAFDHPRQGSIELVAPRALGHLLAANQLGLTPDDPIAQAAGDDALCELVNVTAGAVLRRAEVSPAERFEMTVPRIEPFDAARQWDSYIAGPGVHVLDAEGHTIAICMRGMIS